MSGKSGNPTIRERITCLEVTVVANQKAVMDKIGDCHKLLTNHLKHTSKVNWWLLGIIGLIGSGLIVQGLPGLIRWLATVL